MILSPSDSAKMSRSPQEDHFALEPMNWLLSGSGSSINTSLHSYGSTHHNSSNERLRSGSQSVKFVEQFAEIQADTEQPVDILLQSVNSCIENIFGLYGTEVWQFDEGTGKLINVAISSLGIHIKRAPQEADPNSPSYTSEARDAFERLIYRSRLDFIPPSPVESGVSLSGALWTQTSASGALDAVTSGVMSIGTTVHKRFGLLAGVQPADKTNSAESVVWREVDELVSDPNQV
jgi:hypothetical protein